jgi:integrase
MNTAKDFALYLAEQGEISIPHVLLRPRQLTIKVGEPEVTPWTLEQVQAVFNNATDRTKLYVLMSLNCGCYPSDIATLKRDHVNWKKRRITRPRSKTKNGGKVISWKLWPSTFRLLKQEATENGNFVLLGQNGRPLVNDHIKADGKLGATNAVTSALKRVYKKLGLELQTKGLRKTSASLLETHLEYRYLVDDFLAHSPRTQTKRHYTAGLSLDDAIQWLGQQFGFSE